MVENSRPEPEFYVGWEERAPRSSVRSLRVVISLVLLFSFGSAWVLGRGNAKLPVAGFDFGAPRSFVGTLFGAPVPLLSVERPGLVQSFPATSEYPLTGFGKFGAEPLIAPYLGKRVALEGTLIYRDGKTLIELVQGSIRPMEGEGRRASAPPVAERLGIHTLRRSIVDSKCFFGVMNPGFAKSHRACAARCIAGGIPPVLWVRGGPGPDRYLLLLSSKGEPIGESLLELVAEPVEIRGEIVRYGDLLALFADPETYTRVLQ